LVEEFAPMETQEREQLPGSRQPLHQKLLLARHLGAGIPSARRHSSTEARPRGWQYPRQYMITYDHAWPQPRSRLFSRTFKLIGALGAHAASTTSRLPRSCNRRPGPIQVSRYDSGYPMGP